MSATYTYNVLADVVDVRTDAPKSSDVFLVDTNVWYWMSYSRAGQGSRPPRHYQLTSYPTFLLKARVAHATLLRCELSLGELGALIERTEFDIYRTLGGTATELKEFRHNEAAERANVVGEMQSAWGLVATMGQSFAITVDEVLGNATLGCCVSSQVDPYDAMMTEGAGGIGVKQILTDDGDFCTLPGIVVFTANNRVIAAAKSAGKLVVR